MTQDWELADIWRNPEDERCSQAHAEISSVFRSVALRLPRMRSMRHEERDDEIAESLHDFWIYLTSTPQTLEAKATKGVGALRAEVRRFLYRRGGSSSIEDAREQLRWHLRDKIAGVLPRLDGIEEVLPRHWKPKGVESESGQFIGNELEAELPLLASRLKPQRPDQTPPIVSLEKLEPFLLQCLRSAGRALSVWDLTDLAWRRLVPNPATAFPLAREEETQTNSLTVQPGEPVRMSATEMTIAVSTLHLRNLAISRISFYLAHRAHKRPFRTI